jgi:hypothetical protein
MKNWKVDGKLFDKLQDARKYAKRLRAGLPEDAIVTIYQREETSIGTDMTDMWVPYE